MYNNASILGTSATVGGTGAAGLGMTGAPANLLWLFLAAFALLALGLAVLRLVPRREQ